HGKSPGETAIAWVLGNRTVTGAIVGMRTPDQVTSLVGAGDFRLSAEEMAEVEGGV
ncbi:MAG: aldo/keto reductase, partial [bacterium]